jgi:hypothetical protein
MMWIFGDICLDDEEIWIQVFQCSSFETWILSPISFFHDPGISFHTKKAPGKSSFPFFREKRHVNNGEALLHQVVLQKYINVVLAIQLSGPPKKKSRAGIYALHEAGKPGLQQHVFPVYLA